MLGFWPIGSAAIGDEGFNLTVVLPEVVPLTPASRTYKAKSPRNRVIAAKE